MCGIVGLFSPEAILGDTEKERLDTSVNLQNHRGPDASGTWLGKHIALGHNRLSIIDLSHSADQPFFRADLQLRISFNGEIYNYKTLKKELLAKGYEFHTESDTEVLLVGYHAYGSKICEKLTGMFAFAIWDEAKNELFISRDRFGEKPIFYIHKNNKFYFASELNALREIFSESLTINTDAVIDMLEFMYIHLHHTIYKEVANFPPAHSLKINSAGEMTWEKYYSHPTEVGVPIAFEKLKQLTKEKLYDVVEKQLNADVPVATFLSAGVDSGLISAIAKDIKPDITAVTMSTSEGVTDETEGAKRLASKLNINHEVVPVTTDSVDHLSIIFKDIQPLADASLIPSHLVTNKVKGKFTVMLSGDGGDEIFGSYNRPNLYLNLKGKALPFGDHLVKFGLAISNPALAPRINTRLNDSNRMKLGGWVGFYASHNLNSGLMERVFTKGSEQNHQLKLYRELASKYSSNQSKVSFGIDFQSRLPADFLFKVDSASMHSSIEVRAPFLDHDLVDFLMRVPTESLMPNQIDKELSKSLLSDFTGEKWTAPKKGFTIPYWNYLRVEWGDLLENYLNEGISEQLLNFNKQGIMKMLNSLRKNGGTQYSRILFAVLVMEIWLRVFHLKGREVSSKIIYSKA